MAKKICSAPGCRTVVELTDGSRAVPRCDLHPFTFHTPKKRYDHHYFRGKHIYSSPQWRALRTQYIGLQPLCEHCTRRGIATPAHTVDHVKEIEDGGAVYDIDNLQSLCEPCHKIKTGEEKRRRNQRKKGNGFGLISDF